MDRILLASSRMSSAIRLSLVVVFLFAGFYLDIAGGVEESTHGIKAAVFAMSAAGTLFASLIPVNQGRTGLIVTFYTNLGAAVLAFFAGWHWIQSETQGDSFSFLIVPLGLLVGAAISLFIGFLAALLNEYRRPRQKMTREDELLHLAADKYRRFREGLANEDTKTAEMTGQAMTMELLAANVLLFLMHEARRPLTDDNLYAMLRQYYNKSDDTQDDPLVIALTGALNRIDLVVRSGNERFQHPPR